MIHLNKVLILDKKCNSTGESYICIDTGEGTSVILTSSDNDVIKWFTQRKYYWVTFLVKNMYFNMRVLHLYWYWRECESSLCPARYPKFCLRARKERNWSWAVTVNPVHPNISMHILHTVLYTFPMVLTRRICFKFKSFFSWWLFPIFSRPQCLIQKWYCEEKLDASHS